MSAPLVRPGLSSISALLLIHEVSQAVLGAACSLLGWVWRTVSIPKAMLMDHCLCSNAKILKVYQKIDEWWEKFIRKWEVKVRRSPGTTCHREKWRDVALGYEPRMH